MQKTCDKCHDEPGEKMGVIDGTFYASLGYRCLRKPTNPAFAEYERDRQREKNAKDILQPWDGGKPNEKFVKAYPDQSKEYFRKEDIKGI